MNKLDVMKMQHTVDIYFNKKTNNIQNKLGY